MSTDFVAIGKRYLNFVPKYTGTTVLNLRPRLWNVLQVNSVATSSNKSLGGKLWT